MNHEQHPLPRLLTWRQLKEVFGIPYSREHVRRLEKAGKFPPRLCLSPQKVAWLKGDILAWLQARADERTTRVYRDID
jgi:prophage regulatory protein